MMTTEAVLSVKFKTVQYTKCWKLLLCSL